MEQVQGGRGVLHLVHGQVQVQQLDQLLVGWGRERYHEGRDEGGKEESSDRQLLHKQLFQLLVVHVFLNGMAQLFLRDCSEHGHGKHGGLLHGVSGGVEVPHKVGDGLAG